MRSLTVQQREYGAYWTLDELPATERVAYGAIYMQVAARVESTGIDEEAKTLLGVLPQLLLTDRKLNNHGGSAFLERCQQVVQLRDLGALLPAGPTSARRRRLESARDDERVLKDVLQLIHKP